MANPQKNKGDQAEREAVAFLTEIAPDLIRTGGAERMLGAGRKDDVGDLRVFDDAAVQVKCFDAKYLASGLREAAVGAERQRANAAARHVAGADFALGMVPIPRAPKNGAVRWLAACLMWPDLLAVEDAIVFSQVGPLVTWIRDDVGPHGYMAYPRTQRLARFGTAAADPVYVAPIEAWLSAYRQRRARLPKAA